MSRDPGQLSPPQIAKLLHDVGGWNGANLQRFVQIVLGESGGHVRAINVNPPRAAYIDSQGQRHRARAQTVDRGLFQLNSAHPQITDAMAFDPVLATKAARILWNAYGWQPWAGHTNFHANLADRARKAIADAGLASAPGGGGGLAALSLMALLLAGE